MIYLIDKPCSKPKLKLYTLGIYIYMYMPGYLYIWLVYTYYTQI